jgi:hypothetical protein
MRILFQLIQTIQLLPWCLCIGVVLEWGDSLQTAIVRERARNIYICIYHIISHHITSYHIISIYISYIYIIYIYHIDIYIYSWCQNPYVWYSNSYVWWFLIHTFDIFWCLNHRIFVVSMNSSYLRFLGSGLKAISLQYRWAYFQGNTSGASGSWW